MRSKFTVSRVCEGFGVALLCALFLLVFLQVIFRYVLKISVPWTEEIARVTAIWLTFIGAAVVQAARAQIASTYFAERLPERLRLALGVITSLVSLIFLYFALRGSINMARVSWIIGMGSVPWLSTAWLYLAPIVGLPITMFFVLRDIAVLVGAVGRRTGVSSVQ
ncbi:MAG: TRAP transporter small permease subunit [Bacillota bacterium]